MALSEQYRRQAVLLIRTVPFVAEETCFALKGGTAINLFLRDMQRIGERIRKNLRGVHVTSAKLKGENIVTKHFVELDGMQIKIEVTPVLRGCVYDPEKRSSSPKVEDQFGFAEIQVVSFADLYAGKLVAALDRQHPRDFFDVRDLLANEGIGDELRKAFVVYVLSHNRPMSEVLAPARLDVAQEFERGFEGMSETTVTLEDLYKTRETFIAALVGKMPEEHRKFLLSFEEGKPDWDLLGLPRAEKLPAVQWRLQNLTKIEAKKREQLVERLCKALGMETSG